MADWITIDRILWVFRNKLSSFNQPKLVINQDGQIHLTTLVEGGLVKRVEVKYHFINQDELSEWLGLVQKNEDPDKSYKKIIRKRDKDKGEK